MTGAVSWVILPSPSPTCLMIFSCASAYSFFAVSSALSASSLVICPLIIDLSPWRMESTTSRYEERHQVDLLIDSLQRLSSYGDTGIEAYAGTIGNTWNVTGFQILLLSDLHKVQEMEILASDL